MDDRISYKLSEIKKMTMRSRSFSRIIPIYPLFIALLILTPLSLGSERTTFTQQEQSRLMTNSEQHLQRLSTSVIESIYHPANQLQHQMNNKNTKQSNSFFSSSQKYQGIFDPQSSIKMTLQSMNTNNNQTDSKVIPGIKPSSCQLIVFVFYDGKFKIKLENLQNYGADYVSIQLQNAGLTYQTAVNQQGTAEQVVNIDGTEVGKQEVTEYINVNGIRGTKGYKSTTEDFSQQEIVFSQTRKVYLIRYSAQQWQSVTLPMRSIILTQVLALGLIFLLSHNIRYRRFTPFDFGFIFTFIYSSLLILIIYIDDIVNLISPSSDIQSLDVPKYLIASVAMVLIVFYVMDLLNIFMEEKVPMLIIAILFAVGLVFVDLFVLEDFWYINDIVAVLVSGCVIKFIVVRKMKTSIIPLAILWAFSIGRQFIHVQSVAQEISLSIFPLHFQIPACFGDDPDGYSCSAFGTSKFIIIGLIVNYSIRIDLFISSRFYEVLSITTAMFSLLIELGINLISDEIPIMEYLSIAIFLPVSIGLILAFAEKRGEWAAVWHGSFYDMAVNRTSIRKTERESVSLISEKFGDGLMFTGSYSSCEEVTQSEKQKLTESLVS